MVAFLLFVCFSVQSQQESTNDFIEKRDTSFVNLKEFFKNYRRDTVQLKKLLNVSLKADYDEGASYAYDMLGIAYRNKSNYKRAIQLHNKALEISRKILNVDFKVSSLNMLGVAYRRMDEIRPALEYHKSALEIAESSGKKTETNLRNIAVSYNSIGNLYLTLRQGNLAAEQFQKALSIEKQVDNKLGIAINYQNLGGIFEDRNLLDSALANYRKSLKY
ncbi:MAG: tetratricopeptide repeat protein, partial [Spirosomataceae bacterium]